VKRSVVVLPPARTPSHTVPDGSPSSGSGPATPVTDTVTSEPRIRSPASAMVAAASAVITLVASISSTTSFASRE
jgi:hypothetical protein